MHPIRVAAGAVVAMAGLLCAAPSGRADEPKAAARQAEQSPERVAELERKVEQLERANAELRKQLAGKQRELARRRVAETIVVPPRELRSASVPEHWVPREFNGETFYLIPLKNGGN
jgi:hypothetical protein